MTLERCLIAFSYWTDPFANERLIGTDRAQEHERVIKGGGGASESSSEAQVRGE